MTMRILIPLLVLAFGCSHGGSKLQDHTNIGATLNAGRYSNIYFSGQPSNADISQLNKQGFIAIINLRDPGEYDEKNERDLAKKNNIHYKNIPFRSGATLDNKFIDRLTAEVMKHRKNGKILIHCSSGNRAGLWAGGHFYKDHKYTKKRGRRHCQKTGDHFR